MCSVPLYAFNLGYRLLSDKGVGRGYLPATLFEQDMAQGGPFLGFSLRDTLTRLIPGLIFLSPLVIATAAFIPTLFPNGSIFFILLALAAYLIGEFIDQLRSGLFRVPMSFRYFIYRETDQVEKMPFWYVSLAEFQEKLPDKINFYEDRDDSERLANNLELDFRKDIEAELGVDFVDNRPREIYDLFLIYMEGHLTPRLRRFQSISMFATNLRLAAGGALLLYTPYAIANWGDPFFLSVWAISVLIILFVILFWSFFTTMHYQYDELLLKEYYMKRRQEQNN